MTLEVMTAVLLRLQVLWEVALCCWVRVSKESNAVVFRGAFERSVSINVATQPTSQEDDAFNRSQGTASCSSVCFRMLLREKLTELPQPQHTALTVVVMPQLNTAKKETDVFSFPSKYFSQERMLNLF